MVAYIFETEPELYTPEIRGAMGLLHGFHAIRFPWIHQPTHQFDEVAAAAAELPVEGVLSTWEKHFINPDTTAREISHKLLSVYQKVGAFVMDGHDIIYGHDIRAFLHQVAQQTELTQTHPIPAPLSLDNILPDDTTLVNMHWNGQMKICKPLVDFIDQQRQQAVQDQTQRAVA